MHNRKVWDKWEIIAITYLQSIWIKIENVNYISKWWEIDIIWSNWWKIIFYEVKYRKWEYFWTPEESLTKTKKKNILKAIRSYIFENRILIENISFDFLAISEQDWKPHIKHYKNIAL